MDNLHPEILHLQQPPPAAAAAAAAEAAKAHPAPAVHSEIIKTNPANNFFI